MYFGGHLAQHYESLCLIELEPWCAVLIRFGCVVARELARASDFERRLLHPALQ